MKNEPIDFVWNSMVWYSCCSDGLSLLMVHQRDGSAVPSLASEHLQEVELLRGTERQLAEEVVKSTLGSIFQGEFVRAQLA